MLLKPAVHPSSKYLEKMNSLSVVVPTYNERKRLPKTLKEIISYLEKSGLDCEIIISDSASTDGTLDYVRNIESKIPIEVVTDKVRQGKGSGVKNGVLKAQKEWVLFMDADNSTPISEIEKLKPYTGQDQIVIGSRYKGLEAEQKQGILRRAVSRSGNWFIKKITKLDFKDTQCGFKLFHRDAARDIFSRLQTKGWGFDVEVLMLAKQLNYKVSEVPVLWRDAEGSHLRAGRDSIEALLEVIRVARRVKGSKK